jgi:uncharacterized protein (DUF1778 family)
MASYSNYPLRVPASLMADLRTAAESDGVSINGFVIQAVAEKIAILRARGLLLDVSPEEQAAYLEQRAARSAKGRLADLIGKAGAGDTVPPGDEIPDGWLSEQDPRDDDASARTHAHAAK